MRAPEIVKCLPEGKKVKAGAKATLGDDKAVAGMGRKTCFQPVAAEENVAGLLKTVIV